MRFDTAACRGLPALLPPLLRGCFDAKCAGTDNCLPLCSQQQLMMPVEAECLLQILVYIAAHGDFGTHVFFLKHGAKGGGKKRFAAGGMYNGCTFWSSDLTEAEVEALREINWGNTDEAVEKFGKRASFVRKAIWEHGYNLKGEKPPHGYNHKNHLVSFATSLAASACQSAPFTWMNVTCLMPMHFAAALRTRSTLVAGTLS